MHLAHGPVKGPADHVTPVLKDTPQPRSESTPATTGSGNLNAAAPCFQLASNIFQQSLESAVISAVVAATKASHRHLTAHDSPDSSALNRDMFKLKPVELLHFDGKPINWPDFWDFFETSVTIALTWLTWSKLTYLNPLRGKRRDISS